MIAFRWLCNSSKKLSMSISNILEDGGEGIILRKPNSLYEHGKSQQLIKLKVYYYYYCYFE